MVSYASDITPKPAPSAKPPTSDRPGVAHCLHALVSLLFHVSAMLSRNNARGEAHRHLTFCLSRVKSCRLSHFRLMPVDKAGSTDLIRVKSSTCNSISRAHLISSRERTTLLPSPARFSTLRALPVRRSVLFVIDWRSGQARRGGKAMMGSSGSGSSNCRFQTSRSA